MQRRKFVIGLLVTMIPFVSYSKKKKKKKGKGGSGELEMVKPGEGMAKAVNYQEDRSKIAKDKQAVIAGCAFDEQNCATCMLRQDKGGKKVNGKEVWGCSLFPNKGVYADAWCQSWSKHVSYTCGAKKG